MMLTPNRRMAIFLRASKSGDVLPLNTWLENLYAELFLNDPDIWPYRLGIHEEEVIWEEIISASPLGQSLLKTAGIARLAREAWTLSVQWRISDLEATQHTEDSRALMAWAADYQALCARKRWVDSASFVEQLIDAISNQKIQLPKMITLVGFEELTPQLSFLFDKIRESGTTVHTHSLVSQTGQLSRLSAVDTEAEFRCAALKAKQWLETEPDSRVAVVVLDLEQQRPRVVRIFEEFFPRATFNVSAPVPLNQYPLIDAALLALSLLLGDIPLEKFSRVLRSPFLGEAETEQVFRAALDVGIRDFGDRKFSLENFIKKIEICLQREPKLSCNPWLERLKNVSTLGSQFSRKQSATAWSECFTALLLALGWPGDRILTSEEIEIKQQWVRLLGDYICLGRVLGEHRYSSALSHLTRLAAGTSFLPVSPEGSIQILGMLEAVGIPFDYVWVTGLHREAWPLQPAPNPLIPMAIQRKFNLPRSSAARELSVAKKFTERFSQGGKEVVFSYPTTIEDRATTVSALLEHLPLCVADAPPSSPHPALGVIGRTQRSAPTVFQREDSFPVQTAEKIKGGTQILKLQALCPFRAFAEIRLQAKPLPTEHSGLSGRERGEILHQVLELFWKDIGDQTQLKNLSEIILNQKINTAIDTVFQTWETRYPRSLTPHYVILEKNRTHKLIHRLIELEKTRPFFEIVAQEQTSVVTMAGLEIKTRIDRIDRVSNGAEILIDYKTGVVSTRDWFGERPTDPQLPLYCVTREPRPAGIAFGVLRPESVKYQGVAAEEVVFSGVKTGEIDFADQCAVWEQSLEALAQEFKNGVATVDPIEGEETCRFCSLQSVCRVKAKEGL